MTPTKSASHGSRAANGGLYSPSKQRVSLLVGTRKGGFILHGDRSRNKWKLEGPFFLGNIVYHMVMEPPGGATLHSIQIDPRNPNHMYFGVSTAGVFETTDRGEEWRPLNKGSVADFLPDPNPEYGQDVHNLQTHPLTPDRLYQQNHCGVYRMDRAQGEWIRIGRNLPDH